LEGNLEVTDTFFASELAVIDPSQVSVCLLHRWPQPTLIQGFCRATSLLALSLFFWVLPWLQRFQCTQEAKLFVGWDYYLSC